MFELLLKGNDKVLLLGNKFGNMVPISEGKREADKATH